MGFTLPSVKLHYAGRQAVDTYTPKGLRGYLNRGAFLKLKKRWIPYHYGLRGGLLRSEVNGVVVYPGPANLSLTSRRGDA